MASYGSGIQTLPQSARCEYGPFGDVVLGSGTAATANPFRFSTKYQDDETGLLYYGYRYYTPSTGRWANRDPLGEPGFVLMTTGVQLVFLEKLDGERASRFSQDRMRAELNLFGFVVNDPQNRIDPFGLRDCPAWAEYMCKNPPSEQTREFMGTCGGVVGIFTPWPGDEGLLIGAVLPKLEKALEKCYKCSKVRCKCQRDPPHHLFVRDGKVCRMKHIRMTCYIKGAKGQPPVYEFNGLTYGPCYKFKHGWGGITH